MVDIFLAVEFITTYSIFGVRGGVRVYKCVVNNLLFINYITFIPRPSLSVLTIFPIERANFVIAFGASVAGVRLGCRPYVRLVWLRASAGVMPTR